MKKIYTKNNYLIIEWTGSAPLMRPKKNIFFFRTNSNPNQYLLKDSLQTIPAGLELVLWSDFIKEDNTAFANQTEFNDWITANTGNFNSGTNGGGFVPSNHDLAEFKNNSADKFAKISQMPAKGEKGDTGPEGPQGIQGITGKDGKDGTNGVDGAQGPKGDKGDTGIQGEKGNDGSIGPRGLKGEDGATGIQGPPGIQGIKGDKGDQGLQGDKGDPGTKGDVGQTGPQGPIGLTGPKGDKGDTGATGPKGDQGIQGLKGDTGNSGSAGVNSFSIPALRTPINKATAYQASVTTKPAIITITLSSTSSFTLTGNISNEANIVMGSTNAVATGTGQVMAKYANILGGGLVVGVSVTNKSTQTYTINLPAGYFFAILNANNTTGVTIDSVFEQTVG